MVFFGIIGLIAFVGIGIYSLQEKLIFFPNKLPISYKYSFAHAFEERNFNVDERVNINALHFKAPDSKGVVFYSHGNAGCLRDWGGLADIFINYNYDLLIYDYRGFGKSNGTISESNLYHDASFIYEQMLNEYEENMIIVYGRSIGTGIATKIASEYNPGQLVLESPYYNLPDLAKKIFPFIPSFLLRYKFRTDQMIEFVVCPITLIHGTLDEVIYFESSLKLEKLLKENDKLIAIKDGHHNDLSDFKSYHDALANILR